ncbi:carboxylesterase [Listeria floridensis FSL S10-1187]|uniref:Carboxylesterase n=1 Tax=Listeria floridensis FSL S10-1187 TaxID=1265817 RepID=A0ABP3AY48_9LIST|nr:carboxylesterase [Listeria floridensis FSL S10-1187]
MEYAHKSTDQIAKLKDEINSVMQDIDMIYAPIFVVQGKLDDMVDVSGADWIYETVQSNDKHIKYYDHSGHVITIDKERKILQDDILRFLNQLDWQE